MHIGRLFILFTLVCSTVCFADEAADVCVYSGVPCGIAASIAALVLVSAPAGHAAVVHPVGKDGHVLNLDFETGDLCDWKSEGDAFAATYAEQQVQAHQQAVTLFRGYAGNGDFPELMPWMVVITTSVIIFNLIADLAYAWLDPRIRLD